MRRVEEERDRKKAIQDKILESQNSEEKEKDKNAELLNKFNYLEKQLNDSNAIAKNQFNDLTNIIKEQGEKIQKQSDHIETQNIELNKLSSFLRKYSKRLTIGLILFIISVLFYIFIKDTGVITKILGSLSTI